MGISIMPQLAHGRSSHSDSRAWLTHREKIITVAMNDTNLGIGRLKRDSRLAIGAWFQISEDRHLALIRGQAVLSEQLEFRLPFFVCLCRQGGQIRFQKLIEFEASVCRVIEIGRFLFAAIGQLDLPFTVQTFGARAATKSSRMEIETRSRHSFSSRPLY